MEGRQKVRRFHAILCILVANTASGCGSDESPVPEKPARPAKIMSLEQASTERILSFPAVIRAAQSAELTFEINGEIEEIPVLEAQPIQKGDLIARLDQTNARNALAQARAEYANVSSEYQRAERLFEEDAISESVLDQRRTQRDIARAALSNAEDAFENTVMRAPYTGFIARVYTEPFQIIQAKEPIVRIQSGVVEAVINVPGTIVAQIPSLVNVGTVVELDAAPGREFRGVLKEAAGLANPTTQTYEVIFSFSRPDDILVLPGMTGTVSTTFEAKAVSQFAASGIGVPVSAILAEGEKRFVWVVNPEDSRLTKREVTISATAGDVVSVTDGLNGDEKIVSSGVSFLSEGMKVRPWRPE